MTELDATRWADLYRGSEITPLRESFLTDDNGKVSPAGTSHYSCGARSWACQIVRQNLTHRVNACVVQARLGSHSSHGWCPLPHSGEPACWRDWDQGPPNCPTYPPPYLTQIRARGEWELTNKMTCGRSPRLGGKNEISQNVIKPLSRSAYQLCMPPGTYYRPPGQSRQCNVCGETLTTS